MDFNLDDPLGDLLSDGSNDSFFETTSKRKLSTANTIKQSTKVTSTPAKGKMEDLFGIKEPAQNTPRIVEPETKPITSNPEPALVKKTVEPTRAKNPPVVKADSVFNDDDIISDLGFDPKKPKGGSKSNILDDILGPVEPPKKTQALTPARPVTAGVLQRDESKVISRQSTETTESTVPGTYTASLNKPKTAGRRQSMASGNDPLGLFGSSSNKDKESVEAKEIKETPKIKRKGTTADWLGLDPEPKPQKEAPARSESAATTQKQNQPQILIIPEQQQQLPPAGYSFQIPPTPNVTQGAMLMAASTFETQNALQALKQQEAQMIATTQVKHQEAALLEMQKRQQDLLEQQESQFNELLQKQLTRQNQLEMTIRAQQERINAHIQLMMTHPGMHLSAGGDIREEAPKRTKMEKSGNVDGEEIEIDEIQLQADMKRLQLEKLRLEDLISNINANHEKEIEFMENSHKKQIQVLEHNLQAIEGRLQTEIKSIEEFYSKKLDQIITEKTTTISSYDQKIKDIEEYYENSIKKLKSNYDNDIESIKEDHKRMIENIRQSKMIEFAVVQENASYIDTLRSASNHLETVSGDLQTLKEEMYHKIDIAHKERQLKLELREKKLEDTERRLKITEETSEQEKERLMELVTTLEVQLSKLSKGTAEEQWILRQKLASLEAERTSFEREKELNREQILRDERRVEELKQFQLNENQRLMQQIQDERQLLAAEKTKLDTVKKLHATEMINTPQVEVETALKVAQDASRQADQERERYFKMQRQLEAKKRELIDQENNIRQKQDELESAIVSTKAKERRIQDALQRNRLIEQNFNTKVQMLQSQMRQMAQRETQLSQERIILSKERLDLQDLKRKLELNKCSLCKIGERSAEISQFLTREENPTESEQQLPPDFMTYNVNNLLHSNMDNLFDDGIAESLKKLDSSNFKVNLAADLDITGSNEEIIQHPVNGSSPVPSHFLDSEILLLNFDIKRNFLDE